MKVSIAPDFRDLFRPMTAEEYEQAKANNEADPNHERIPPVVVWDGIIIDGHHTHRIRESLRDGDGKPVKIRYAKMEFADRAAAMAYAIHAQIGRRNLDPSQIAMAIAKLPKASRGGDHRSDQSGQLATLVSGPSRDELADEAGIGRKTLQRADKVTEQGAKAVQDAVVAGEVSVSDAASIVDLPKGEQTKAVKEVKAGKAKTLKAAAKKKTDAPPISGPDTKALYKEWDRAIGPLVRLVDRIAGQVNGKRGEHHKTVQEHLNAATEEMMAWMGVSK
jgi:hypothetical protein